MEKLELLEKVINESNNIVIMTGAGLSTASGIPDFRSSTGIYNTQYIYPPEQILSHTFFLNHTKEFYEFYRNKMIYQDALPNAAHKAIANLEKMGKVKLVITQNIDGLHTLAGSKNVFELHGTILKNHCVKCNKEYDLQRIIDNKIKCDCGGTIKPDVVLYEELLNHSLLEQSAKWIEQADTLIVLGTSLTVNPAASLVRFYKGNNFIIINKTPTPYDRYASLLIHDPVEEVLKKWS